MQWLGAKTEQVRMEGIPDICDCLHDSDQSQTGQVRWALQEKHELQEVLGIWGGACTHWMPHHLTKEQTLETQQLFTAKHGFLQ